MFYVLFIARHYLPIFLCSLLLNACQILPSLDDRVNSTYLLNPDTQLSTALHIPTTNHAHVTSPMSMSTPEHPQPESQNPNNTPTTQENQAMYYSAYIYNLVDAKDALSARVTLIDNAQTAIDIQYYIWRNDVSGNLLFQKIFQAAKRGVRIRLLLDDNNTRGLDNLLAVLNQHTNIQIRLFNPFIYRQWRALGYLTDFPRLNRRMHNKLLIADNQAAILGGRNIGDEYFDIDRNTAFADLDVLVAGEIITPLAQDFDRYWNSESAYPLEKIIKRPNYQKGYQQLNTDYHQQQTYWVYQNHLQYSNFSQALRQGNLNYIHAQTQLVSDDPAKALDRRVKVDIAEELRRALQQPQQEMYLVSPYFVPTKIGTAALTSLAKQGIHITILTNSLRATDVAAVHSGYARYRRPLLKAGIQLYEFKADNAVLTQKDKGLTGSSAASLHAKTFVIDRQRIFIGSFNLDPRSARLNTEMGLVIYHSQLAESMQQSLQHFTTQTAYHLTLDAQNRLQWQNPDTGEISRQEPEASLWKRIISKILSYLPIERLL